MANSTKTATQSYAFTSFLSALVENSRHVAAITSHRAQNNDTCERIEAFLARIQRISMTGTFFWHAATVEITASEQVYQIFDLDPMLPLTLEVMATRIHPDDLPLFHAGVEQTRSALSHGDFESRLRMPDGSVKYVHIILQGIEDNAGEREYIGAVHDGTSRRWSEDAPGQAGAALTQMARLTTLGILAPAIAHELTQPLAGIMTNANTCLLALAADPPSLDAARAAARRALRDVERAHDLCTRLRTLASKKEAAFELLDLNEAIQETLELFSSELQKRRVQPRTEFAVDLPRVRGDRIQLQQVVLNLLANSSEAMSDVEDRPRHLQIKTDRYDGTQVRVTVRDVGIGFHPRDAEKLFDPSYTTKGNSMGVGLYISRTIVERHRGRLWAELNEGYGAAISFTIPQTV